MAQAATGATHTVLLSAEGEVYFSGKIEGLWKTSFVRVLSREQGEVRSVHAAGGCCAALLGSGEVYVWGDNSCQQLGPGPAFLEQPTLLAGATHVTQCSLGATHLVLLEEAERPNDLLPVVSPLSEAEHVLLESWRPENLIAYHGSQGSRLGPARRGVAAAVVSVAEQRDVLLAAPQFELHGERAVRRVLLAARDGGVHPREPGADRAAEGLLLRAVQQEQCRGTSAGAGGEGCGARREGCGARREGCGGREGSNAGGGEDIEEDPHHAAAQIHEGKQGANGTQGGRGGFGFGFGPGFGHRRPPERRERHHDDGDDGADAGGSGEEARDPRGVRGQAVLLPDVPRGAPAARAAAVPGRRRTASP